MAEEGVDGIDEGEKWSGCDQIGEKWDTIERLVKRCIEIKCADRLSPASQKMKKAYVQ